MALSVGNLGNYAMGSMKYEIEKFTGNNDFGLWMNKMRAILVQQGLLEALKGDDGLSTSTKEQIKEELWRRHTVP